MPLNDIPRGFLRLGETGSEIPCFCTSAGIIRDLSDWIPDLSGDLLDPESLAALAGLVEREGGTLPALPAFDTRIAPPVSPSQIVSIGLNYADHAAQVGMTVPNEPVVAAKSPHALAGPYDPLVIPDGARHVDWEAELAVVIGRPAYRLPDRAAAARSICGYCVANDLSDRHWLLARGGQWLKGKSFAGFAPLGPVLVPASLIGTADKRLTCRVNDVLMQDARTGEMIFDPAYLVWYVSTFMMLAPGDVVLTGSPAGVAFGRDDRAYLKDGDTVAVEIEGLGVQRLCCHAES